MTSAVRTQHTGAADGGFTVLELTVALAITLVSLLLLAGVFVSSLQTIGQARERQVSTALVNQTLERLRALPFSDITAGMTSSDLSGDPRITGSPPRLTMNGVSEVLQTTTATGREPIFPHKVSQTLGKISYTRWTYVSIVPASNPAQYSLTSVVTWKGTGGKDRQVVLRSRAFSANGACVPANHPYNQPCQAQSTVRLGRRVVPSSARSQRWGPDRERRRLAVAGAGPPTLTASSTTEQVVTVSGRIGGDAVRDQAADTGSETVHETIRITGASTDPSNPGGSLPMTASAAAVSALPVNQGGWSPTATPGANPSGESISTISAQTSQNCKDTSGTVIASSSPCGAGSIVKSGGASHPYRRPSHPAGTQPPSLRSGIGSRGNRD